MNRGCQESRPVERNIYIWHWQEQRTVGETVTWLPGQSWRERNMRRYQVLRSTDQSRAQELQHAPQPHKPTNQDSCTMSGEEGVANQKEELIPGVSMGRSSVATSTRVHSSSKTWKLSRKSFTVLLLTVKRLNGKKKERKKENDLPKMETS